VCYFLFIDLCIYYAAARGSETAASRIDDIRLFVRLSVCCQNAKKRDFLKNYAT